jgi:hypothetical protein
MNGSYHSAVQCAGKGINVADHITVNPKSADFSHAKTRLLYADVWQNPAIVRRPFWRKFTQVRILF